MNRRELHVVSTIDGGRERAARRSRMRDRALDVVAGAMREVIDPDDRAELAKELCVASAVNAAQARGPSATGTHLASLSGQAFSAAEQILKIGKRRVACSAL